MAQYIPGGHSLPELLINGQHDLLRSLRTLENHSPPLARAQVARALEQRLGKQGNMALSPWVYALYWKAGCDLLRQPQEAPSPGLIEGLHREIARSLPKFTVMSFGDHSVDAIQWLALVELFAEGGDFLPDLDGVNAERCTSQATEIADARHFISTVDSTLGRGMDALQAIVILAEPGPLAKDVGKSFGSASSFFFRGGSIVNAAIKRSFCDWIITLIHEYAHSELFLISQNELMCTNPDHERYSIQIRPDPRPMNGILHSFYVVGRVITFLQSAIQNAMPGRSDRDNFVQEMAARCLSLKQLMQSSHRAIRTHGRLTPLGEEVVQLSCSSIGLGPQPVG